MAQFLRYMICKSNLIDLLEKCFAYVICEEQGVELASLFYDSIEVNEKNFETFKSELDNIKDILKADLQFFMDSDPAASSLDEIKMAYPGFRAIATYRISHALYKLGYKVEARYLSESAHSSTGIDIHPGAEIDYP